MAIKLVTLAEVTVTATAAQVFSAPFALAQVIIFRAPSGNTGSVYIGDADVASTRGIEIAKGTQFVLQSTPGHGGGGQLQSLENIYCRGTANDKLYVSFLSPTA